MEVLYVSISVACNEYYRPEGPNRKSTTMTSEQKFRLSVKIPAPEVKFPGKTFASCIFVERLRCKSTPEAPTNSVIAQDERPQPPPSQVAPR